MGRPLLTVEARDTSDQVRLSGNTWEGGIVLISSLSIKVKRVIEINREDLLSHAEYFKRS